VIKAFGDAVELVNVFRYFEAGDSERNASGAKPLCFVESNNDGHWEQRILAPLLAASGYQVSFDEADRTSAAIVLSSDGRDVEDPGNDTRVLRLRSTGHAIQGANASIYRYDRVGLISAIEAKLAGAL
jgi:two-component system, chemotaxis family, sensor kinase CheA